MNRLRRVRRDDRDRQAGVSLVELLVTTVLFGVISALVTSLTINTLRQTAALGTRMNNVDAARVAMDALSKTLRTAVQPAQLQSTCVSCSGGVSGATAIKAATASSVQFYSNSALATGPQKLTYTAQWDAAQGAATLTESKQPADAGSAPNFTYCNPGPACPVAKRTLVTGLAWPLAAPLFTYFDDSAARMSPGPSGLTSSQLYAVHSVGITLSVRKTNSYRVGSTTIVNQVSLPNVYAGVLPLPVASGGAP